MIVDPRHGSVKVTIVARGSPVREEIAWATTNGQGIFFLHASLPTGNHALLVKGPTVSGGLGANYATSPDKAVGRERRLVAASA